MDVPRLGGVLSHPRRKDNNAPRVGHPGFAYGTGKGGLEFVLSHPFARKKAKGWGTEVLALGRAQGFCGNVCLGVRAAGLPGSGSPVFLIHTDGLSLARVWAEGFPPGARAENRMLSQAECERPVTGGTHCLKYAAGDLERMA